MTTRNSQFQIRNVPARRWVWPALFVALLLSFFAVGVLISDRGLLNRWLGQSGATIPSDQAQVRVGQGQQTQSDRRSPTGTTASAVVGVVNGQVITIRP